MTSGTKPSIILHDETQLLDWGESRSTGPWIKLRLSDPDLLDCFRPMDTATLKKTGHIIHCTLAEGDIAQLVEADDDQSEKKHGAFWRQLIASGFFRAPAVLRMIGSESEFESWIRTLPSVLDGAIDWDTGKGEIRNEVCHVRRVAEGSGTAEKPPYFAVPMSHLQHEMQHKHGEIRVIQEFAGKELELYDAREWFSNRADQMRSEWASKRLASKILSGCSSRAQVDPDHVRDWVAANNLGQYLPNRLRG